VNSHASYLDSGTSHDRFVVAEKLNSLRLSKMSRLLVILLVYSLGLTRAYGCLTNCASISILPPRNFPR